MNHPEWHLVLASGQRTVSITSVGVQEELELYSTHEEADTKMVFHAYVADACFSNAGVNGHIIINSTDIDVLVLLLHHCKKLAHTTELWMEKCIATKLLNRSHYIPIHDIQITLSTDVCDILPAAYGLTGCDTTCALSFIGRRSMMKCLTEHHNDLKELKHMYSSDNHVASFEAAPKFIVLLYGAK